MAGYKYHWTCPECGTNLQLKMRVTQTKRKCPHCGFRVTPEEIDRQNQINSVIAIAFGVLVLILCGMCGLIIGSNGFSVLTTTTPSVPAPSASLPPPILTPPDNAPTPAVPPIDLSTPENAFESYLSAMRSLRVDNFIATLSKKRIRQELASPILNSDASGKKFKSINEIIAYQFQLKRLAPRTSSLEDYDLGRGYSLLGDAQIKGNSALVWYSNSGRWMVCRLSKEGKDWKVDDHFSYPKKWEEDAFFRERRKKSGSQ